MKSLNFACAFVSLIWCVNCGIIYTSQQGNEYFIETESQLQHTWFEAIYECSRRNMTLIAIETEEKQREISDVLCIAKDVYRWYPSKLWIAGIGTGFGNYVWVTTGTKFNYTNWSVGEPERENDDQQCAALHAKRMTWYIRKCSVKRGLICEGNRLLKQKTQELTALKETCAENVRALDAKYSNKYETLKRDFDIMKIHHETEKKLLMDKIGNCNCRSDEKNCKY